MNPASDNVAVPNANATSYSCRRQETESLIHEWGQRRITDVVLGFGHWSLVVLRTRFKCLCLGLGLEAQVPGRILGLEGQVFDPSLGLEGQILGPIFGLEGQLFDPGLSLEGQVLGLEGLPYYELQKQTLTSFFGKFFQLSSVSVTYGMLFP